MKVLIVDDQAFNRQLLGFILDDYDWQHVEASNGEEAVVCVEADIDIDMVLMDVNMPIMDGMEATRRIKQRLSNRFLPIVFVTALDNDEVLAECLKAGGDDFVAKPINESVLLAKLAAHQRTVSIYKELQDTNARLSYHRRLMDREHAIVEHVFQNSMQRVSTACDNLKFHISPMSMFNGDLLLMTPSASGGVYVLLGDFTGHGLSAAIGCMPVADIFYAMTKKQASIGDIAAELNLKLQDLLPSNMFFCAAILELSSKGERLTYWVGGMNDLLLVAPDGGIIERFGAQHMPLGILSAQEFDRAVEVVLPPLGSKVFVYTDGVIETQSPSGDMFDEERLAVLFETPAASYVERVSAAVYEFQGDGEQTDDVSIVELACEPVIYGDTQSSTALSLAQECDTLPWRLQFQLTPKEIVCDDVVANIIRQLSTKGSLATHTDIVYTLLSELYSNALEHGLLALDSSQKQSADGFESYYQQRNQRLQQLQEGAIDISLKLQGESLNLLEISVTDSGSGFDFEARQTEEGNNNDSCYGRGLGLLLSFAESLNYSNGGRTATLLYRLD